MNNDNKNDNETLSAEIILAVAAAGMMFGTYEAVNMPPGGPIGLLGNIMIFLTFSIGFAFAVPLLLFLLLHLMYMFSGNNALIGLLIVFICCAAYFFLTIY